MGLLYGITGSETIDRRDERTRLLSSQPAEKKTRDSAPGIHDEGQFTRLFHAEKKRTSRSKKPFFIMHINLSGLKPYPEGFVNRMDRSLTRHIRETDIRGWHMQGSILGIMFTEIELMSAEVKDILFQKTAAAFSSELDREDMRKIDVTFHQFPQKHGDAKLSRQLCLERQGSSTKAHTGWRFSRVIDYVTGIWSF